MEEFFAGFFAGATFILISMVLLGTSPVDIEHQWEQAAIEKGFAKWEIVDPKNGNTKFVWKTLDEIKK